MQTFKLVDGNPDLIKTLEAMTVGEYETHLVTYLKANQKTNKSEDSE